MSGSVRAFSPTPQRPQHEPGEEAFAMPAMPKRKGAHMRHEPTIAADRSTHWLVLRCASSDTLALSRSLDRAGLTTWIPVEERTVRVTKANIKRKLPFAMMPGYVFADFANWTELLELSHQRTKDHKPFTVFKQNGETVLVPDRHLAPLRMIERRRKPRGNVKPIPVGTKVRFTSGGFEGLDGTVQQVRNKMALVSFDGLPMPVQVGCWLLKEMVDESKQLR